jgi:hypothetical protein
LHFSYYEKNSAYTFLAFCATAPSGAIVCAGNAGLWPAEFSPLGAAWVGPRGAGGSDMPDDRDALMRRLEATIGSWGADVSQAHAAIGRQLADAQEQLLTLLRVLGGPEADTPGYGALLEDAARLRAEVSRRDQEIQELNDAVVSLERELLRLESATAEKDATPRIDPEAQARTQMAEELFQLRAQDEINAAALVESEAQLTELRGQLSARTEDLDAARQTAAESRERNRRLERDHAAALENLAAAQAKLAERELALEGQQTEITRLRSELDATARSVADHEAGEAGGPNGGAALLDADESPEGLDASLIAELEELREAAVQHAAEIEGLRNALVDRTTELRFLREKHDQLSAAHGESEAEMQATREELTRLRRALAERQRELRAAREGRGLSPEAADALAAIEEIETLDTAGTEGAGNANADDATPRRTTELMQEGLEARLRDAAAGQGKRLLGTILTEAGVVPPDAVALAITEQQHNPARRIGAILLELGFIDESTLALALAAQLGLPFVTLDGRFIDEDAAGLIDPNFAAHHRCIPLALSDGALLLAMANPLDGATRAAVAQAVGRPVRPVVAALTDVVSAVSRLYGAAM